MLFHTSSLRPSALAAMHPLACLALVLALTVFAVPGVRADMCEGIEDGTTCDDENPNTPFSSCQGGVCVGECESDFQLIDGKCLAIDCRNQPDATPCIFELDASQSATCLNSFCEISCTFPLVLNGTTCVLSCPPLNEPQNALVVSCPLTFVRIQNLFDHLNY